MKKYNYTISTNTIWTSFDFGQVEANDLEEARQKAIDELKYNLEKANHVWASADVTDGFTIEFNFDNLEVEEVRS